MARYRVYGTVTASKYLGEVEASSEEEAEKKAWAMDVASVSVCHQCSRDVSDPEISEITVELDDAQPPGAKSWTPANLLPDEQDMLTAYRYRTNAEAKDCLTLLQRLSEARAELARAREAIDEAAPYLKELAETPCDDDGSRCGCCRFADSQVGEAIRALEGGE
jgi:hypothetical protein